MNNPIAGQTKNIQNYISATYPDGHTEILFTTLARSQHGWHEGTEDTMPFIKYFLGIVLAAYKDFEDRFSIVETKLPAVEMVKMATQNKIGKSTYYIRLK